MKNLLFILISLLIACSLKAQSDTKEPENEFAFASRSSDPLNRALSLPGDTVKYKRALKVFNQLVAARGDFRYAIPDFVMTRDVRKVAWMNYDRMEIGIEEKAYDVCMTFGADADAALASLLGHELSHYYEKHSWRREFAHKFADMNVGKQLGSMTQADSVFNETQADYVGGFLAFSAGFPVFEKGAELTGALYKAYGLPDALRIYPTLEERKQLNDRSSQLLDKLVNVYETANLLTAVGNYQDAVMYYQYVLQDYQSPEIYNNAGVLAILAAMDVYRDSIHSFLLPIELDMSSIKSRGNGAENAEYEAYIRLLREAVRHFDAAINLNPNYAPAYLNKACALVLLHDNIRAQFYIDTELQGAIRRSGAYKKTAIDGKVLQGILAVVAGDSVKADQIFFDLAEKDSSAIAGENLVRLRTKKPSPFVSAPPTLSFTVETIDDIALLMEAEELAVDYNGRIGIGPGLIFYQNINLKEDAHSKFLVADGFAAEKSVKRKTATTYFLVTQPGYKGQTEHSIQIGSSSDAVFSAYKSPKKHIETTTGQLWLYDNIIFFISNKPGHEVTGWALWLEI